MDTTAEVDPVCGMTVDPAKTTLRAELEGRTYWFCSPGCKRRFEANPAEFLGGPGREVVRGSD